MTEILTQKVAVINYTFDFRKKVATNMEVLRAKVGKDLMFHVYSFLDAYWLPELYILIFVSSPSSKEPPSSDPDFHFRVIDCMLSVDSH